MRGDNLFFKLANDVKAVSLVETGSWELSDKCTFAKDSLLGGAEAAGTVAMALKAVGL